jgi:hypothetical protein
LRKSARYSFDRGLIPRIYKELKKLDTNKMNNPINVCKGIEQTLSKEEVQTTNEYMAKKNLHILIHQGNAIQNYIEIPPYLSQMACLFYTCITIPNLPEDTNYDFFLNTTLFFYLLNNLFLQISI